MRQWRLCWLAMLVMRMLVYRPCGLVESWTVCLVVCGRGELYSCLYAVNCVSCGLCGLFVMWAVSCSPCGLCVCVGGGGSWMSVWVVDFLCNTFYDYREPVTVSAWGLENGVRPSTIQPCEPADSPRVRRLIVWLSGPGGGGGSDGGGGGAATVVTGQRGRHIGQLAPSPPARQDQL